MQTALLISGAIGVWLGIQAMRMYFAMVVWNVAEDQATTQLGLVALAVWVVGLLGWIVTRAVGGARPAYRFAALLAILVVARQVLVDEALTAALAFAGVIVWLWWLPAFIDEAARLGASRLVALAVVLGVAAQVAAELALHGLEIPYLAGAAGAIAALALATSFVIATRFVPEIPRGAATGASWGAVAIGPLLFLEMTLLANIGFVEALSGWDITLAGLLIEASLALAIAAIAFVPSSVPRVVIGLVALTSVLVCRSGGAAIFAVVPAQAALAVLLSDALAVSRGQRTYVATYVGAFLYFVFVFASYADYANRTAAYVWPVAVVAVTLPAIRATTDAYRAARRIAVAAAVIGLLGVILSWMPTRSNVTASAAPDDLVVLDYNVHQGFDLHGVPALPRAADVIASKDPDIVTLQEVNRVWDLSGGVDSYSWLRSRFASYYAVFGPMHGVHFGNAIFSRYPIAESGSVRFPIGPSGLPRSFVWARVPTSRGDVLVVATHLTPYDRGEERTERGEQAAAILAFWDSRGRPRAIVAGDFNDEPDSPAATRMVAAGFIDVLAGQNLGAAMTFASSGSPFAPPSEQKLDYIFVTKDIAGMSAEIMSVTTSDHRPVVVQLRLR